MLRDKTLRRFALWLFLFSALSAAAGFFISRAAGILAIVSAAVFCAAFFLFTRARYRSIAQLSYQIDLVLHNADRLDLGEMEEGELSILHSEITKMLLRIREQNDALGREKLHLAHSLADIAHQLRTPLTSANLCLSLLADSTDLTARRAFAREAEDLLLRMDWLLTALLKLSRLDAGVVTFAQGRIKVRDMLSEALRPFQIPMELHGIAVHLDAPDDIFLICDAAWLSEAVQNILKNCVESVGDHGTITLTCTDNPLFTEITIHDSGPGFAAEDLPRLFDRYYRGKQTSAAGYGIGLALCRRIVTEQGGTITAQNHAQGGALFVLRFSK